MSEARRVKVEGDLFHGRVPDGAVYVGRAAPGLPQSPYRNRHRVGKPCQQCGGAVHTLGESLALYATDLDENPELIEQARRDLAGRDLCCWCKLTDPCHVDELLQRVNADETDDFCPDCLEYVCVCTPIYVRHVEDVPTGGLL
ncbi:DUF4326 domain-containing protein [Actinomadura viridis]|uniref:DUF4326 domain-containing protein n=1 Tax=Actinomadura viridis TaxID=58110 RepID=A0A931DH22_9ACTN|nr:DUF4326 domain-containing protein [Actinomadura viridis]MBG6089935.1 hypothetical protein [Actinomadura viridis]